MAREINLVCGFFFCFMNTNLPVDTVDMWNLPSGWSKGYTYIVRTTQQSPSFLLHGVKV